MGTLGLERAAVALQRSHTSRGGSVDLVVLAAAAAGQLPHSGGRGRRHVDDLFAAGQQPRRHVPSRLGCGGPLMDRPHRRGLLERAITASASAATVR
jgi:hypothetical protein